MKPPAIKRIVSDLNVWAAGDAQLNRYNHTNHTKMKDQNLIRTTFEVLLAFIVLKTLLTVVRL